MTSAESAILMGFPSEWRLPHGSRVSQRAVGNALCVEMSKAIMEAAMKAKSQTVTQTIQPLPLSSKRSEPDTASDAPEYNTAYELHKIYRRLRRMEKALLPPTATACSMERTPDCDAEVGAEGGALVHTSGDLGAGGADQLCE